MTETTTEDAGRLRFDGPDCGYGGWCEREVGHIGDHAGSSMPWDARQREARNALRAELRAGLDAMPEGWNAPDAHGNPRHWKPYDAVLDLIGEDES